VPVAGTAERGKERHLVRGLKALLAQLDDVHPGPEDRIKERGQVSLPLPRIGAQVQPGSGQPGPQVTSHHRSPPGRQHQAPGRPGQPHSPRGGQNASACARRFTSVRRFSLIAWIGVPGSVSSAVNSQRSASASSNPQSKSSVSVPCSPRMT
jgi:hypothetical protein